MNNLVMALYSISFIAAFALLYYVVRTNYPFVVTVLAAMLCYIFSMLSVGIWLSGLGVEAWRNLFKRII